MKNVIYIAACASLIGLSSCQDIFIDLEPLDTKTELVYFKHPSISVSMLRDFIIS